MVLFNKEISLKRYFFFNFDNQIYLTDIKQNQRKVNKNQTGNGKGTK